MNQLYSAESAVFSRRSRRAQLAATARQALVRVSWSLEMDDVDAVAGPRQLVLQAALAGSPDEAARTGWSCEELPADAWLDAISASRCSEVLLTAEVGDSGPAQQQVLELAGQLTRQLEHTKPVVRVRFLPSPARTRRGGRPLPASL